jgi:ABC-type multidrug transport system ATPase subunit
LSELTLTAVWSPPLKNFSATLPTGLHVVLGGDADGTANIIELCAGVRLPRRGVVAVDGEQPGASPRLRCRIASLLPVETTSGRADVRAWLHDVAALRGLAVERIVELAAVALSLTRPLDSLSSAERRHLALLVALAEPQPTLVALHEPLAAAGALSRELVLTRIGELVHQAVVLVTTASVEDARQLGGTLYVLERGVLARKHEHAWPTALTPGLEARLWIDADSPRELVAALAQSPDVREARYVSERIELHGGDLERLAMAVSRAAVSTGVHVRRLQSEAPDLEAVHGASAGLAHAAYRAAQQQRPSGPRTIATKPPATSGPSGGSPP